MFGRTTIRAALCALGLGILAIACGRTSLHRCDLVGCQPGQVCADAGGSVADSGSDAFNCVLPDGGTPCTVPGESCIIRGAGPCCSGSFCNSSGVCAANVDAGK
jgi:hypothetical protein